MSRATFCLQYRLIIQFFMVAALVATNVFNVFTMNLGTTGLPLGQVRSGDADAIHRTMLFTTALFHGQHAVDEVEAADHTSTSSSCRATLSATRSLGSY
jgi:hypothetical protein